MGCIVDGVFLGFFKVESRKILYSNNNIGSVAFPSSFSSARTMAFFFVAGEFPLAVVRLFPFVDSGVDRVPIRFGCPPFRQVVSRANAMKAGRILPVIAARRSCRFMVCGLRSSAGRYRTD